MTAVAVCVLITCRDCGGGGEVGTRQDYWGNWDTERCGMCRGEGMVSEQRIAEWEGDQ